MLRELNINLDRCLSTGFIVVLVMWLGLTMPVALARAREEGRVDRSVYWDDGLHLIGPHENLELTITPIFAGSIWP
ncbi:MAG: hypothetical protein U9Q05_14035 [Thermodesulfobacteriota bacterium]|nr:hypothetical protein [Thermodesulfobacteriota bacterium]